ncbi:hypothetical protein [Paeniglutamicibacter antarcticus]|uniref:Uncharacterized protein n=1 Tax=Paeniglutamicibacter antarcticus TaxID=494023 RepID=A0ABP9TLD5_9MICC
MASFATSIDARSSTHRCLCVALVAKARRPANGLTRPASSITTPPMEVPETDDHHTSSGIQAFSDEKPFGVLVPGYLPMVSSSGVRNVLGASVVLEDLGVDDAAVARDISLSHAAVGKLIIENLGRGFAPVARRFEEVSPGDPVGPGIGIVAVHHLVRRGEDGVRGAGVSTGRDLEVRLDDV